ncbi:E3 ubiquitin-protein ligase RFWD3-like, partial [Brachypodium distachyon]|uniref:E3 ubiquitin-protein ligase RFWD3-like n=1 Tax=Brachypodium distachyon TaxID=15368 RepID=UPI000D0C9745
NLLPSSLPAPGDGEEHSADGRRHAARRSTVSPRRDGCRRVEVPRRTCRRDLDDEEIPDDDDDDDHFSDDEDEDSPEEEDDDYKDEVPKRRRSWKQTRPPPGTCCVCMEPWTPDGAHRMCCIPCGHLYGRSCLENWLHGGGSKTAKCGQMYVKKQIINLY